MPRLRIGILGLVVLYLASVSMAEPAGAAGPFWHVNGAKLKQGSEGAQLQNKGSMSLKGLVSGLAVTVSCGTIEGSGTIDGQGETKQGQAKAQGKFGECKVAVGTEGKCGKPTTVGINQVKAHLAKATVQGKEQIVTLIEASSGTVIAEIPLNECKESLLNGLKLPVKGSVAGVAEPQETEVEIGSLYFPSEPIKVVKHEGQEVKVGLILSTSEAVFTGYFSGALESGKMGVFST